MTKLATTVLQATIFYTRYQIPIATNMANSETSDLDDAVRELLATYQELNGSIVEELHEHPTPLEFMRYVHKGRPFVVRGGVSDWPAMQWTIEYLKQIMGKTTIQVAVTPSGLVSGVKKCVPQ